VRTSCCALRPYLRPEERRLLADVLALPRLAVVRRRLDEAVVRRRDAVVRERVLRARVLRERELAERLRAEVVRRREPAERERVDVERLRGERRAEARALVPRLRPRVDVFLVAIPSHSPCEVSAHTCACALLKNEIAHVHMGLCIRWGHRLSAFGIRRTDCREFPAGGVPSIQPAECQRYNTRYHLSAVRYRGMF